MPDATLTVTPRTYNSGDTLTATYAVTGNDGTPSRPLVISGNVTIDGVSYALSATATANAVDPLPVTYAAPTAPGLAFGATADPATFTATAP